MFWWCMVMSGLRNRVTAMARSGIFVDCWSGTSSHQSTFYRRGKIRSLGIEYNPRYSLYADRDYNLKLLCLGRFCYVPLPVASYACTGASSQRVDERFLAKKKTNALRYFGWRACFLMPPYRFALACGPRPGPRLAVQLMVNRLVWLLQRPWRSAG